MTWKPKNHLDLGMIRKFEILQDFPIPIITNMSLQQDKSHSIISAYSRHYFNWILAINNEHFTWWLGLTATVVWQHLSILPATLEGDAKQPQQNILSQQNQPNMKIGTIKHQFWEWKATIICRAAIVDTKNETNYIDLAGIFPCCSLEGNKCILVVYVYNSIAIIVHLMPNREASTLVSTCQDICNMLDKRYKNHNSVSWAI